MAERLIATVAAARQHRLSREPGPIDILLPAGRILLPRGFEILGLSDNAGDAPLTFKGDPNQGTQLVGDVQIPPTAIRHTGTTSGGGTTLIEVDWSKVRPGFAPKIALRGSHREGARSTLEVFQGDRRFRFSRWPRSGFSTDLTLSPTRPGLGTPSVIFGESLLSPLGEDPHGYIAGFWEAEWSFETAKLTRGPDKSTYLLPTLRRAGIKDRQPRAFLFNLKSVAKTPGDHYLDEGTNKSSLIGSENLTTLTYATASTIVSIINSANVHFDNISFGRSLGNAVDIRGSKDLSFRDCAVYQTGGWAITASNSTSVRIERCYISDISEGAVTLDGGDVSSLSRSGNIVSGSWFRDFGVDSLTYRPGVSLKGVGAVVENSLFEDAPHSAILVAGSEHVITRNVVRHVVRSADDAGAIYFGRDWGARGNVVSSNIFSEIGMPSERGSLPQRNASNGFVSGVYVDDQFGDVSIEGNHFVNVSRPVVIHGGRDNRISGNTFISAEHAAIFFAKRGEGLGGTLEQRLRALPFSQPPYSKRYPELSSLLDDSPGDPLRNRITANRVSGTPLLAFKDQADGRFLDAVYGNNEGLISPEELRVAISRNVDQIKSRIFFRNVQQ